MNYFAMTADCMLFGSFDSRAIPYELRKQDGPVYSNFLAQIRNL
jgi:hypothetical protein